MSNINGDLAKEEIHDEKLIGIFISGPLCFLFILSPFWLPLLAAYLCKIIEPYVVGHQNLYANIVALSVISSFLLGLLGIIKLKSPGIVLKVIFCVLYTPISIFVLFWVGFAALGIVGIGH